MLPEGIRHFNGRFSGFVPTASLNSREALLDTLGLALSDTLIIMEKSRDGATSRLSYHSPDSQVQP